MSLKEKKQELQDLREKALADVKDMENGTVDAETRDEWIKRNDTIDALAKEVREMEVFESKKAQLENDVEEGKAVEVTAPVFNEVPVEEKVAAHFLAIIPLFPTPEIIIFPCLQLRINLTTFEKDAFIPFFKFFKAFISN